MRETFSCAGREKIENASLLKIGDRSGVSDELPKVHYNISEYYVYSLWLLVNASSKLVIYTESF